MSTRRHQGRCASLRVAARRCAMTLPVVRLVLRGPIGVRGPDGPPTTSGLPQIAVDKAPVEAHSHGRRGVPEGALNDFESG